MMVMKEFFNDFTQLPCPVKSSYLREFSLVGPGLHSPSRFSSFPYPVPCSPWGIGLSRSTSHRLHHYLSRSEPSQTHYSCMSNSPPSVGIRNDKDKDVVVTLGLNTGDIESAEDTGETQEDMVVHCGPYRPKGKLSIRFTDAYAIPHSRPPIHVPAKRKIGTSFAEDKAEETLVDPESSDEESEFESDWFEGPGEKIKASQKQQYLRYVRRYPSPELDRLRRESGRFLWFSQKHPHLYDENGRLNHEQARKEGHGWRLPTFPPRKRARVDKNSTGLRVGPQTARLSAGSSRWNARMEAMQEDTSGLDEIVPDSEEER
ncbi:hypothetical protein PM082_012441 [Marasmius tenuissimus]|nr:hypothetical protein PM082_012441 [Marasmius tenuissimus]